MRYQISPSDVYKSLVLSGFYSKRSERQIIPTVLENFKGDMLAVQLPTGYGKTSIVYSLGLYNILNPENSIRTIHVLPLRSIIEDAYSNFIGNIKNIGLSKVLKLTAKQMMYVPGSPFLNKLLIFTTFDTFSMHLMKFPPAEATKIIRSSEWTNYGHYEVSRGAILESTVILDEPQILLDSPSSRDALASLLFFLAWSKIPTIIMTATFPKFLRDFMINVSNCTGTAYSNIIYGETYKDPEFEAIERGKKIKTRIEKVNEITSIVEKVLEKSGSYERILVVLNKVDRAIGVYNALIRKGLSPILLHGKLTSRDKERAIERLKENEWIIVSTQVIEAGVNISAQILITDIAPASSLVQRAGRVARFEEEFGEITILLDKNSFNNFSDKYHVYSLDLTLNTLKILEKENTVWWRIPRTKEGLGYQELIDRVYVHEKMFPKPSKIRHMLNPFSSSKDAIIEVLGEGFIREAKLINVLVWNEELNLEEREFIKNLSKFGFPATIRFIKRLLQTGDVKLLVYKGRTIMSIDDYSTLKKMLTLTFPEIYMVHLGVLGVQIDTKLYQKVAYGVSS